MIGNWDADEGNEQCFLLMVQKKSPGWRQPHILEALAVSPSLLLTSGSLEPIFLVPTVCQGITKSFVIYPQLTFWKEPPTHPLNLISGRFHFYHDHKHNRHCVLDRCQYDVKCFTWIRLQNPVC